MYGTRVHRKHVYIGEPHPLPIPFSRVATPTSFVLYYTAVMVVTQSIYTAQQLVSFPDPFRKNRERGLGTRLLSTVDSYHRGRGYVGCRHGCGSQQREECTNGLGLPEGADRCRREAGGRRLLCHMVSSLAWPETMVRAYCCVCAINSMAIQLLTSLSAVAGISVQASSRTYILF